MRLVLCFVLGICLLSCHSPGARYPYTLADFRPALREHLQHIINEGSFSIHTESAESYVKKHASDKELIKMTRSEHPLFRALALIASLERPNMDHYGLLMEHLDDTAYIALYGQCTSYPHQHVADHFIYQFDKWKNFEQKQKVIDEVITKHNYLEAAYTILDKVEKKPEYYSSIRKMVESEKYQSYMGAYAWAALAQYKKPEDAVLLRDVFINSYNHTPATFLIIAQNPDTAYFPFLESYFRRNFYSDIRDNQMNYEEYFNAVAAYKNKNAVKLLDLVLTLAEKQPTRYTVDAEVLLFLYFALEENRCAIYEPLMARLEPTIAHKRTQIIRFNGPVMAADTCELDGW